MQSHTRFHCIMAITFVVASCSYSTVTLTVAAPVQEVYALPPMRQASSDNTLQCRKYIPPLDTYLPKVDDSKFSKANKDQRIGMLLNNIQDLRALVESDRVVRERAYIEYLRHCTN